MLRGWRVFAYTRLDDFLEFAEAGGLSSFDILVLDYTLPGLCAPDVLRWLAARRIELPVAVVSGTVDAQQHASLLMAHIPVLLKPVPSAVLRAALLKEMRDFEARARGRIGAPSVAIDLDLLVARAGRDRTSLTVQHGRILAAMLECARAGRIATDAELEVAGWPDGSGSTRKLVVNVDRMTSRVPALAALIERIPDCGYRFRLPTSRSGTLVKVQSLERDELLAVAKNGG